MKSIVLFRILFLCVVALCGASVVCAADDLGTIKARMERRADTIETLKARLVVGESNRGFLERRDGGTPAEEKIVSEENSDRQAVYTALAKQTGEKADVIGRQRAQQLGQLARRGMWVQDAGGQWRQKQ